MPRKTKEQIELENNSKKETKAPKKTSSTKASTSKKSTSTKKTSATKKATDSKKSTSATKTSTAKKSTTSKPDIEKKTTSNSKSSTNKNSSTQKKSASKSTITKKATTSKKNTTAKKVTASKKNTTAKKATTVKTKTTKKSVSKKRTAVKKPEIVEYYDLPYRYNQTIVKVLAQTPTKLFIYWDISDADKKNFEKQYGENFFETTKPVLIVYNDTLRYNFEVEINDFANSWYLHVADSNCDYRIELGRRPIVKNEKLNTDYIYITTSNEIESPNDKILFNKEQKMVYFRNVKTKVESSKYINTISFMQNIGKIYDIYDLYRAIYQNEDVEEIYNTSNPSSGNPSSNF